MTKTNTKWHDDVIEYIPDGDKFDDYIHREVSPGVDEFEMFDYAREANAHVLIEGPTGCGKTHSVYAYAATHGIPVYSVPCNGAADPAALFGTYVPDEEAGEGFVWRDGPVTKLARHGGILLLNEINFLPAKVAVTLFELLDKRGSLSILDHDEFFHASEDLLVIADYNDGYIGTKRLTEALKNRFSVFMTYGYLTEIEKELVHSKTLIKIAEKLREGYKSGEIRTPVATNKLPDFEKIAVAVSFDAAIDNFVAGFDPDEKEAVRKVISSMRSELEEDYGVEYE